MSAPFKSDPTDDPEFIAVIRRIAERLFKLGDYDGLYVIEIKNWFDHKWLNFSGIGRVPFEDFRDDHPQTALGEFWQEKITFPPFTPKRILRQQWHPGKSPKKGKAVHYTEYQEHSSWNLHRRVAQFSKSALFVWFSSGTKANDRGSMMVYQVHAGSVSTWYVSFRKANGWVLNQTKGTAREAVESLMDVNAGPDQCAAATGQTVIFS